MMKHLETDDVKNILLNKSALQRDALRNEATLITAGTEKIITNALIIGGALAMTYFIVSQLSASKPKRNKHKKIRLITEPATTETEVHTEAHTPGIISQLGNALASQATIFLLNMAKEKISAYLDAQAQKKENS